MSRARRRLVTPGKEDSAGPLRGGRGQSEPSRRGVSRVAAVALLALGGMSLARLSGCIVELDMTMFRMAAVDHPERWWTLTWILLAEMLLLRRSTPPERLVRILAPLAILIPFHFLPFGFPVVIVTLLATSWVVYRYVLTEGIPGAAGLVRWCGRHPGWCAATGTLLTLGLMAQGIYASLLAYDTLYLAGTDWMTYAEICRNTFLGNWFRGDYPEPAFSAGHWMPGFFLVFAPLFGLVPRVETAFVLNAVLLWGSAGLVFLLGRKIGLSPFYALAGGVIYLLFPSVSNMNLCLFYGFNAIYLFIPCFLLFLMLKEEGHERWAFVLFLFTLTIKETVGVFWAGWGLMEILAGRRRNGGLYAVIGVAWLLLAMKGIIPLFSAGKDYIFYGQYEHLGHGVWGVLCSPFTRPDVFFGTLLAEKNLLFLLLLLVPVFPAAMKRPALLGAGGLLLLSHLLRNSRDVVNINQHYQTELVVCFAAAVVLAFRHCRSGGRWEKWLAAGLGRGGPRGRGRIRFALAVATLVSGGVAHWLFAQSFYGLHSLRFLRESPRMGKILDEVRQEIPPGSRVEAGENVAGHFLFRNPTTRLGEGVKGAEYRVYALGTPISPSAALHRMALLDPEFGLVGVRTVGRHKLFWYRRGASASALPEPQIWPDPVFYAVGTEVEMLTPVDWIAVRGEIVQENGRRKFRARVRFATAPADFCEVRILLLGNGELREFSICPGDGRRLPESILPGEVFTGEIDIPEDWTTFDSAARLTGINADRWHLIPADATIR